MSSTKITKEHEEPETQMKCHNCGTELPDNAKFCDKCGEKQWTGRQPILSDDEIAEIEARSRTDEYVSKLRQIIKDGIDIEQRDVAVMFVDVSGSTPMSPSLSEAQVREVMRDVYSVMSGAIARCAGYTDKFIGDEVMAIFGAPIALERPCERAIAAADEIEIGLAAVNQRFRDTLPAPFSVHAGVAFGQLEAGKLGDDHKFEYTILGETVELASRLADAATSGEVFVSQEVQERANEAFEFEDLREQQFAGIGEPVKVFRFIGPWATLGERPGLSGLGAPMFGRSSELGRLKYAFDKLASCYPEPKPCRTGQGRYRNLSWIISIIGEAGVGKSRLTQEFLRHLRSQFGHDSFRWLTGAGLDIEQTPLYWPIKMQIASALGFDATASSETIADALSMLAFHDASDEAEIVPYLYHLFGLQYPDSPLYALEPKAVRDNLWLAVRRLYALWSRDRPLVLVLEDMHWADRGTADFVEYLSDFVSDFPVLVLLLYRPGYDPKTADREGAPFTKMRLAPLSGDAEAKLLDFYVAPGDRERAFIQSLSRHSKGNPLFVEELLQLLLEEGKLELEDAKMYLTEVVEGIPLPTGLTEVLGKRFDRLAQRDKRAAYYGAVIGSSFPYSLLSHLHESLHGASEVRDALDSLVQREIIFQNAMEPEPGYSFKHSVVRKTIVSRLVSSLRRELSSLVASRIEELNEDRLDEFHGILSFHWEVAGEIERAARSAGLCGIHNVEQRRNFEAQAAFEKYDRLCQQLASVPLSIGEQVSLLVARIDQLEVLGRWEEATGLCESLASLEGGKWRALALFKEARLRQLTGDYDVSLSLGKQALENARAAGDRETQARAMNTIGIVHQERGDYDRALQSFEEALLISREVADSGTASKALHNIGLIQWFQGDYKQAYRHYHEALSMFQKLGNRVGASTAMRNIGILHRERGEYQQALRCFDEAFSMSRELGDRAGIANTLMSIGVVHLFAGDHDRALQSLDKALIGFQGLGDRQGQGKALNDIGLVNRARGEYEQARKSFDAMLRLSRDTGDRTGVAIAVTNIAAVQADAGQWAEARATALQADRLTRSIGNQEYLSEALSVLSIADAGLGNFDQSLSFGTEALSIADRIDAHGPMLSSRMALSEAHLKIARSYERAGEGATPTLSRVNAAAKASDYARQAKELAESKGMKGYVKEADALLAQIEKSNHE